MLRLLVITLSLLLLAPARIPAAEVSFTYFQSPAGTTRAGPGPLPERLDAEGGPRWRTPLDSGHSTPIVTGGRIFLTTYKASAQQLSTVALDAKTGQVLWQQTAPAKEIEAFHRATGNPAQATPASDGQRLYVLFGSCGLLCYDLDGHLLWKHALGPFRDEYGSGSSPILVDDKIILQEDHDVESFLMALDREKGTVLWRTARPDAVRSYSTPAVWSRNGRKELLVAGALELAGYDLANGEKLWWTHGLARIVIPVPVPSDPVIYMASWAPGGDMGRRLALDAWPTALSKWDKNHDGRLARTEVEDREVLERFFRMDLDQSGDLDQKEWERHAEVFRLAQNAVLALKPSASRGELSPGDLLWKHERGVPYVATPLLDHGILWMVKDGGIVTKLDTPTGKVLQEERLPGLGNYYASPVGGDGKVYFASELGVVSVVAAVPEWRVISSRDFKEKIYATPVTDGTRLLVRTEKALYCFEGKGR